MSEMNEGQQARFAARRAEHIMKVGQQGAVVTWRGELNVEPAELERALADGWDRDGVDGWEVSQVGPGKLLLLPNPNLVVSSGVHISLDRLFAISGPPTQVRSMGVDDGAANPVAGTTDSTAGSTNRRIVLFDATPTRTALVVSALGTFTQATVAFTIKRLFLSKAAAGTTDSAGDLYAMTDVFTLDLSAFTTWSQTFEADVTGAGS